MKAIFSLFLLCLPVFATGYNFIIYNVPGAAITEASDMVTPQIVVGQYVNPNSLYSGFTDVSNVFQFVNDPQANVVLTAIHSGKLIGQLRASGRATSIVINGQHPAPTISYPGSTATFAMDLNATGTIVGYYEPPAGGPATLGFLYSKGTYTNYGVPFTQATRIVGINDAGTFVGSGQPSGSTAFQGFITSGGNVLTFKYPGAFSTSATGINNSGIVVGSYLNRAAGPSHGFTFDPSTNTYTSFDAPNAISTLPSHIKDNGDIVGTVILSTGSSGFVAQPAQ